MFCCAPCADTWEGLSEPGAHLEECEVRTPKWIIQQEVSGGSEVDGGRMGGWPGATP